MVDTAGEWMEWDYAYARAGWWWCIFFSFYYVRWPNLQMPYRHKSNHVAFVLLTERWRTASSQMSHHQLQREAMVRHDPINRRAGASLSEPPPLNIPVRPTTNIHFNDHPPLSLFRSGDFNFKKAFIFPQFSDDFLVVSLQHFFLLNFISVGPFTYRDPFLRVALYTYIRPFTIIWGPVTPWWLEQSHCVSWS